MQLVVLAGVARPTVWMSEYAREPLFMPEVAFAVADLTTVSIAERGDPLVLWKFARAGERLEARLILPSPLEPFALWRANDHSYYLGDEERPTALLSSGEAMKLREEVVAQQDLHSVPGPQGRGYVDVRRRFPRMPVPISGSPGEWVPLRAFEAGCDDFVGKPVSYLELRARVRAILRRTMRGHANSPRRVGALLIDPDRLEARYAGTRLELSRLEFALLCQLASEPARVFTKRELLRDVWGYRAEARTRTLDAHACRLRRKLHRAGAPGHVVNRRGVGYRLVDRTPAAAGSYEPAATDGDGALVALRRVDTAA